MKKQLLWLICIMLLSGCGTQKRTNQTTIRIGTIRVTNDTTLNIQRGYYESLLAGEDVKIETYVFDSGVAMNQAFQGGSLDFAEMGYTNAIVALSSDIPVHLFWIHEVIGASEALVARQAITSIHELRGKRVATIFNSTAHYSLIKALSLANMTTDDITLYNLSTAQIVAAWERGDLDAAYTWEPTLTTIRTSGHVLIDSAQLAQQGYMTTNVGLVSDAFAKAHPDYVRAYVASLQQAVTAYQNDPEDAIRDIGSYLDIATDTVRIQVAGSTWLNATEQLSEQYLGNEDTPGHFMDVFQETATTWEALGFIDTSIDQASIRSFIDTSWLEDLQP